MSEKLKPCSLCGGNRRADRWIPVSERLPEKDGLYLTTTYLKSPHYLEPDIQVSMHRFYADKGFWCNFITAWRPLPQPYEEGKDAE